MLDALFDQYYTCSMENIFISEQFLQVAYTETKSTIRVHGVFQKKGCGLLNFFVQEV